MKKIVFRVDGSTATDNIELIFKWVKQNFKEATKEVASVGRFSYDCYISVNSENLAAAYKQIKGYASHAMYA